MASFLSSSLFLFQFAQLSCFLPSSSSITLQNCIFVFIAPLVVKACSGPRLRSLATAKVFPFGEVISSHSTARVHGWMAGWPRECEWGNQLILSPSLPPSVRVADCTCVLIQCYINWGWILTPKGEEVGDRDWSGIISCVMFILPPNSIRQLIFMWIVIHVFMVHMLMICFTSMIHVLIEFQWPALCWWIYLSSCRKYLVVMLTILL